MDNVYVALDLETTGLDPARDSIIEIGAARFRGNEILETWSSLVDPGTHVPGMVSRLTGITDEMVQGQPTLSMVAPSLLNFIGEAPIVGHNIGFDVRFLQMHGLPVYNLTIDTFELATILLPLQGRYTLTSLSQSLGIELENAHRALDDAIASARLFQALVEYASNLPLSVVRQINRLAARTEWPLAPIFLGLEHAIARGKKRAVLSRRSTGGGGPLFEDREPLKPRENPEPIDVDYAASLLEEGGVMSRVMPGYEYRPSQVAMLRAVAEAFNKGEHLLVEAATGTGKSLAYLIPAVLYSIKNDARVVVSTNTINLQDQLFSKDLPALETLLKEEGFGEHPFTATVLKGRSNYICMRRLDNLLARADFSPKEMTTIAKILVWLNHTSTGDQSELFLPSPTDQSIWMRVRTERESCIYERCPYFRNGTCHFFNARRKAERANIVVVNHALLLSDITTQQKVLPPYKHLIVDEAHHLEEAITRQLSFDTDEYKLNGLLETLYHSPRRGKNKPMGLLVDVMSLSASLPFQTQQELNALVSSIQEDIASLRTALREFFDVMKNVLRQVSGKGWENSGYNRRIRITTGVRVQPAWTDAEIVWEDVGALMYRVADKVSRVARGLVDLGIQDEEVEGLIADLYSVAKNLAEAQEQISSMIGNPNLGEVYWAEVTVPEHGEVVSFHSAPLHVGPLVEEYLINEKDTVVMTSATLQTAGSFEYLQDRLNAWEMNTLALESPFDYESSTLLYLPTDMPEPNSPGYQHAVEQAILKLAQATDGRMLVLFTSYAHLRRTYDALYAPFSEIGITVYTQGNGASRSQLLENFRTTEKAVLFGTRSFWEGVDIVGPSLSVLVIVRLPFDVPNDPIVSARSETFEQPFLEYAVPEAILRFRQGFGRLIRSRTDRGVVVVLDKRIVSKRYGKLFLESLPSCTLHKGPLADLPARASRWLEGR